MVNRWTIGAAVMLGLLGAMAVTGLGLSPLEDDPEALSEAEASTAPETSTVSPSSDSAYEEFTMFGCRETFAHTEVPESVLEPHLPGGFEPISSPFTPAGDLRPTGWFVAVTNHCDRIVFDGSGTEEREVTDNQRLWYAAAVDPPDEFEDPDVDVYFYPFRVVASQQASADVLADWDQDVETGTFDLTRRVTGFSPWVWGVEAESQNVSFEQGARGAFQLSFHEPLVRLFGHPSDGSVDHAIDMQPQGNTRYSYASQLDIDLDAPDSPFPDGVPREPVQGNLKATPSGQAALHGNLVSLTDASS